ncbi:uncharacterized protein LOC103711560 isoform X1 [Phoenix dactylifera]|uniref:Uncharacterized protein LOC103711560 isoform X1 n=2 Tax=Phoenix dactylifera TaxID=42345 RepID=A0A8B7MVP0_PHODC|nr:uncharacterized protein LOC103711560 isoform X1 [Phoenix dactylifera]
MATEAGILESISEKKEQDETEDLRCVQNHKPPEYTNKPLEVLKEHSNESEIKGGETDSAALQSSQMIGQYPPYKAATPTSESSTLSESSKDQSSHSVTVGIIDSSEGEVFVEAPPGVQIHLEDICNGSNAGIQREDPINKEKEKLESGIILQKDQKDDLDEEKDVTVPKNSSSEANFTDASLYTAAVTNVPLEEKMQRNDFGNDHPVKKSDEHFVESIGANQNTEQAVVLGEEKTSTGIHETSVVNQYQDLENLGDNVDDKQPEKSIDLVHEKQDLEAIKDKEKSETQESIENLSANTERLQLPEDLGETGLQKEDEENDKVDASEEEILKSLDTTEKVSEIQYGKTSADVSVKELSNLQSAEESVLEDEMLLEKVKKVSFKEQEAIQSARVILIEMEPCKEQMHTEMDTRKCTSQMKKEPEESNIIEDSMADKDVECINLVSTEKSPETIYASKNIETEDLDERKEDGQMDASLSTKTEVLGIENDQMITMIHKETYSVLYEENSLEANDAMDAGDDSKKGENLNEQAKAKSVEEKFEEACRIVEVLDTRETKAAAISMDEPHVVPTTDILTEDIIQDQETTHSRDEKENEVLEEEENSYDNIDASASSQLTDEIQSLTEEKEAQKFEEISDVVQDKDHCHEKVLNQDDLKAQITVYGIPEVSKAQKEEGIQEHEDKDGINIDKIERVFEDKHVQAIAETKPSNRIKASEKGHAQEAVSGHTEEHVDETINEGTLGCERIKAETDSAKLESNFIVVSKEVEVTEGIANTEEVDIDSKLPMSMEEMPKEDEAMCEETEKAAAELIHEYQTIMTNDLNKTGIPIEKNENSKENVGDLPLAQNLEEETIQVCENMDHIKQELEPETVENASKSASRHQSQTTIGDTEATDLDRLGDGVSMDKTLGASSTIQAFILRDTQKATDPEEAEEKIYEKTNENISHDKHLGRSLEEEAQKGIHQKIDDDRRMEDIILGDEQIDDTKARLCSNEEQMEGKKLDKGDELKQGKETYEAIVNKDICLEENPIVDAPENVQKDKKWGNKLEKPSDEISVKILMAQERSSNKEDVKEKGSPEEKEESSQEPDEVGVTLEQTVDRLGTEDLSHKPHCKDEKPSTITGQNANADEARNDSSVDISDTHELAGQHIDDLEGSKHEEVSNSAYEDPIDENTDTKDNKVVDDHDKASQNLEMISVSEDKNREITCETEATKIENLNADYNLNNMQISETINMNGDKETARSMDEEFLEKNIKDTSDSHSLAMQKIHDAAGEKHESDTSIESEEQIHQTTSNKDNIDTDICKENTDSNRLGFISESGPEDQSGESDAPKVDNIADDDKLKIPATGDLNDDHETAKVKYQSILERSMDTIFDSRTSVLEETYGRVNEKHKAPNPMAEEQIHQATNTEENIQVAVYNENIDIKSLEIVVKSVPEDQSPDKMTSKIEKTLDEDMINDTVIPLSNSQASIKDRLQEEENLTVYAESTGVQQITERPILKEETNNDATLGSGLKHNVIENACELESEEKQDEVPEKKETSDTVLEESPSMMSDTLERSIEILSEKQMIWEKEANENKASLSMGCDFVEEGFQEDKEETKIADLAPESAYSNKSNETNEVNNSTKIGITNKEVETSDDDQSHEASCLGKEHIIIKLQSEDNENANIKDEESTNNRVNDTPVTSALGSEAASGSLHGGQRESITREEETIRNMKLDQEAASDLTSVEQNLEEIIKTDLANIHILEEGVSHAKKKYNLVAQYMESEVVHSNDEECISNTDGNLHTMPVPAKEGRKEIQEKHEKYPNYEEQIHESRIANNNMDDDTLEEDKNIEEIERDPVRVSEEQSHEGTTRTGIIENEILEGALAASQNFDEDKTSKIAFLSEGNEHGSEAGEVCKSAICTLLREAKAIDGAASGTSMQPEGMEADELNEAHTSVFNRKSESLDPEKNQEEETPTRERGSDACIGTPSNLASVEPALAARAENMVDLTKEEWKATKIMDKEVKDSVLASHENSETTAETKSTELEPKDDSLTVKQNSVEENMQKDAYWVGPEDHIHDATEDRETSEWVALENRNKEEMEEREMLQSKKMEEGRKKESKEIPADMEISEAIYPSECNNESSEEKGTLNKGLEKETLEVVELEKPLSAFNIMEESEFTDRFVPNEEEPEVERSLQAKEMKDEKQEEGNKIQSKEKISEADSTNKCNKESSEEKEISERGTEKQKPGDVELQNILNVVPEGLEVAYQTENINPDGQEKEVIDNILEEGFHKKEDKALEDTVIDLDIVDHSNEPNHDSDATEGVLAQEKILKVANFSAKEEDQIRMVGNSSIKSDLVEEIKHVEPSGSHLQESVEPKALETEEKFENIIFEEESEKNEKLGVGSQNDANEVMQLEEASNMVFDRLLTTGLSEKTETKITAEDVEAPDVSHVRDKPLHEQIQGYENKTEIKKPETKREFEETDTIVNETLNDKVKEPGYMSSEKNHVKMELSEKIDTTSPVDEEEPTKNVEFSSITTASSSEIMQDVSENLDKESVPKESTQIDAKTKVMGIEFANNMMNDEEGPVAIEKFEHISTNSVFVDRTCNKNSMTTDANEKGEEAIDQEDREKLEEASNSVSNEKVDEWDDSLVAFIEDKDNSQNAPIKQATEVTSSAEEKEMIWQMEGETHEKVRDFRNSENEENQQTDQDDLPVSRILMDQILQEEGDKLAEACDAKREDKLQENIHDQQNDVNISKQERNSVSLSVEQVKDDTSISEGKEEALLKIEGSSNLVQQSHDLKKDTENAILKDDESPDRNLHDTSLTMTVGEDVKDELSHLLAKELTNIVSYNNMEPVLAEEGSPESKANLDELKKQDNIIPIPAPEMMTESTIQKDDESLKKNSDVATVIEAFEEDTLKKESGNESPEISQGIAENDKASYATSEEKTPSAAEPVGNAKGEIQVEETVSNIQGDQTGKSFQSSSVEDNTLGEASETQSGGIKVENGKKNQDGNAESRMKDEKKNLLEELEVADSHKVQQSESIVEPTNETVQAGERFLAERSPTVSADEKQAKEIADAHMKEEKTDEEKYEKEEEDENKTEESGHDAAVVVEAKDADVKPAHKKSHNILSGVGSKVKHSIAKVKKAITGKSSHSKTLS